MYFSCSSFVTRYHNIAYNRACDCIPVRRTCSRLFGKFLLIALIVLLIAPTPNAYSESTALGLRASKLTSATTNRKKKKRRKEQCRDGIDNDGDGLIDYGRDPGCRKKKDKNEGDDPVPPVPQPSPTLPTPPGAGYGDGVSLGGRRPFPDNNPWNQDVSTLPVDSNSQTILASIGLTTGLHPDFGTVYNDAPNGIPYTVVSAQQARSYVQFEYADESDIGPYPIPENPPIEGGLLGQGDRHILIVDLDHWLLYELYAAYKVGATWRAGSGAIFDLNSNALRPSGWTSADAAGLPIFPGLVRYDEAVLAGEIRHALRFTVQRSRRGYVWPATHFASSATDPNLPPMGMRVRLKSSFDISGFPSEVQVILRALKTYGMFVADNGSNWFVSGAPDPRWNDDNLSTLRYVQGQDFEVVQMGEIVTQ